jgi:1-acyl-sn-glycerol-3-phosphate acyltransferase
MVILKTVHFWLFFWSYTAAQFIRVLATCWRYRHASMLECSCAMHEVAADWGQAILNMTPGWDYELRGEQYLPRNQGEPFILVANHESAADIGALFATRIQFRWLSKASVFKLPMIGRAMRWAGYVPIKRGNKKSHKDAMEQSAAWLKQGISMAFFPEGSRSHDGNLKDFKPGAFVLAEKTGAGILPIALHGTGQMLAKQSIIPKPAHVIISILEPLRPAEGESRTDFIHRVRQVIANELTKLKQESSAQTLESTPKQINASY